jgi:predicted nuclease of predicted toxin-antitoxin system
MNLLVNENIPTSVVQSLRARGHDVLAVKETMRGADDPTILARAQVERRLLVTQDKDFGELALLA